MDASNYQTHSDLPALAGLCTMQRAMDASDWSVEESVERWKRIHFCLRGVCEAFIPRINTEPIYELKTLYSHHAYLLSEQITTIRNRVSEMREPPLGLDKIPHPGLQIAIQDLQRVPITSWFLVGCYQVLLPAVQQACSAIKLQAHPVADAPSVRAAKLIAFELEELVDVGREAAQALLKQEGVDREHTLERWLEHLQSCLAFAEVPDDTDQENTPPPTAWQYEQTYCFSSEPCRDERFQDPFNAGVNPEAFLYDEQFSPQDKTLMMYYKRIRELDVPETMASILVELQGEEPWGFQREMLRQLWDEARHAMMGEVGFVSLGIDWTQIPINFTWSRNLNTQLDARERHGVLFFIEQGLMTRTGKRYEWEIAQQSEDRLAALFQDFDWADEVLHAQIGRRWYVPRFGSLQEALGFGDRAWSQVLSHWREYLEAGLTEHRNWWPELYRQACEHWHKDPDPAALAFATTYEGKRADLKELS